MKKTVSVCVFLLSLSLTLNAAPLKIGWASRDVSTAEPIIMTGLFNLRVSQGVLDPTLVTALAIDNSQDSVIFLSCDAIAVNRNIVVGIKKRLTQLNPEIPTGKLIVNATHTHTSATLTPINKKHLPPEIKTCDELKYISFFIEQSASAIAEAWKNRAPGAVAWGYGYAVTAHSRRTVFSDDLSLRPGAEKYSGIQDGHAKMHGNTADAKFSHYEAGSDPFVNYLFTFDSKGKLSGAIVNLAATAQCGGQNLQKISADYWNEFRIALQKKYGPVFVLPQCSAAGDLTPRLQHYKAAQNRRLRLKYGTDVESAIAKRLDLTEQLLQSFEEVLSWAKKEIRSDLPLRHSVSTVRLARRMITESEFREAQKRLAEAKELSTHATTPEQQLLQSTRYKTFSDKAQSVIARYQNQQKAPTYLSEIHVVRLGPIAFATNNFELFMDYMHRIQGRSPFEQTFIVQLTASDLGVATGYLPTERAVAAKGYSADIFSYDIISPQGGQQLVDETVRLLRQLHKK